MLGNIKYEKIFLQKFNFDMALGLTLGIYDFAVKFLLIIILSDYLFLYIYFYFFITIRH